MHHTLKVSHSSISSTTYRDSLSSLCISRRSSLNSPADTPITPWSPTDEDSIDNRIKIASTTSVAPMTPSLDNKMLLFEPRVATPVDPYKDEVGLSGNVVGQQLMGDVVQYQPISQNFVPPPVITIDPTGTSAQTKHTAAPDSPEHRDSIESMEVLQKRLREHDNRSATCPNSISNRYSTVGSHTRMTSVHQRMLLIKPATPKSTTTRSVERVKSPLTKKENIRSIHAEIIHEQEQPPINRLSMTISADQGRRGRHIFRKRINATIDFCDTIIGREFKKDPYNGPSPVKSFFKKLFHLY
jgi:hypothetical protein